MPQDCLRDKRLSPVEGVFGLRPDRIHQAQQPNTAVESVKRAALKTYGSTLEIAYFIKGMLMPQIKATPITLMSGK